jgi:hypothetical protein
MQQRQLRLGDTLDDYCTRERRLTNHVVVAMVGDAVKQTRCTTCDTEHEYKHAKVPRQRRKSDSPAALYAQVAAGAPKRVTAQSAAPPGGEHDDDVNAAAGSEAVEDAAVEHDERADDAEIKISLTPEDDRIAEEIQPDEDADDHREDEGPVHRPLIRASLPREGQPPPARPIPEFTIRQPGGRPNRFRPRTPGGGGQPFRGDRSNGNGFGGQRSAGPRHGGGRPPQGGMSSRPARRHGPGGSGRKRQK